MSLHHYLNRLTQRFDTQALQPPEAAPAATEASLRQRDPATWQQLSAWCRAGAGPGGSGWFNPGGQPSVDKRWAAAALGGPAAAAWADAFARDLDGGSALDLLPGRLAGLALRLRVKAADAAWWRLRQDADPWDAGWVRSAPPALRQLQGPWLPRRATLLLADAADQRALRLAQATLQQRSDAFDHPVRWLWVATDASAVSAPLAAPGERFFALPGGDR